MVERNVVSVSLILAASELLALLLPSEEDTPVTADDSAAAVSVDVFLFLVVAAAGPKFSSESSLVSENRRFLADERFGVLT